MDKATQLLQQPHFASPQAIFEHFQQASVGPGSLQAQLGKALSAHVHALFSHRDYRN